MSPDSTDKSVNIGMPDEFGYNDLEELYELRKANLKFLNSQKTGAKNEDGTPELGPDGKPLREVKNYRELYTIGPKNKIMKLTDDPNFTRRYDARGEDYEGDISQLLKGYKINYRPNHPTRAQILANSNIRSVHNAYARTTDTWGDEGYIGDGDEATPRAMKTD
jgi:hypothetical protein